MSDFDDRDDYWTTPTVERKTLRETTPLPITPHYPPAAMVETSWGFRVPRHLREACENAYHDAKDRMRVRGEAESADLDKGVYNAPGASQFSPVAENITPTHSDALRPVPESFSGTPRPRPRLLGWEPPPQDHVEAYLRAGGS